jgi:hypothetical protein
MQEVRGSNPRSSTQVKGFFRSRERFVRVAYSSKVQQRQVQ